MRPGETPTVSAAASRVQGQGPVLMHVPGPRAAAAAAPERVVPIRLVPDSDAPSDHMARGRSNLSDESGSGSSALMRSRQAEEAAARARSLSSEGQLAMRSSPWQDADGEYSVGVVGARRPSAVPMGDGMNGRVMLQAPAFAVAPASDSLPVFEKPLLAALSGDDLGGVPAAEVRAQAALRVTAASSLMHFCRMRATPTWRAPATTSAWAGPPASTGRGCPRMHLTALSEAPQHYS